MKKLVLTSALLTGTFCFNAQELKWANEYFYIDNETMAREIAVSADKKIALAGHFASFSGKRQGAFVVTLSENGDVMWTDTIFKEGKTEPHAIPGALEYDNTGNLYLAVNYRDSIRYKNVLYTSPGNAALLIKYSQAGSVVWAQNITYAHMADIHFDVSDNGFFLLNVSGPASAFSQTLPASGKADVVAVKVNSADAPLATWHVRGNNYGRSIKTTSSGEVVIFGAWADSLHYLNNHYDFSHQENFDGYLLRTDAAGDLVSFVPVFDDMFYHPNDMTVLANGNAVVCARYSYKGSFAGVEVYDAAGQLKGKDYFSGNGYSSGNEVVRLAASGNNFWALHFESNTVDYGLDYDDYLNLELCKYDGQVNRLLRDTFIISDMSNQQADICVGSDGDIYMGGTVPINDTIKIGNRMLINGDEYDLHSTFFVARFADKENTLGVPRLSKAHKPAMLYPNPSSGVLHFDGDTGIVIYNLLGTKVYSGQARSEINLQHLEKGVYVAELTNGKEKQLQKIVLR